MSAAGTSVSNTISKKNALVQRLQASLAGRINPMANMGPPPMIHIPRGDNHSDSVSSFAGRASSDTDGVGTSNENGGNATSEEQQYEAETAHMTAAERLRFLRKKRQETMFAKEKIVEEDDFMKEFERNMTKKHDGSFDWRKKREDEHAKEREARERERERAREKEEAERRHQQAREEEKARKQREREEAEEDEREREAENERRRQREEQAKREREQELAKEQEETERREEQKLEETKSCEKKNERAKEVDEDAEENGREPVGEADGPRERSSSHGKQSEKKSKHKRENGDAPNAVVTNADSEEASHVAQEETREPKDEVHTKEESEADQHQKPKHDKQRRRSEHHETLAEYGDAAGNGIGHSTDGEGDEEAAELERQRLKQEKRERRRLAKLEAAVAAQSLEESSSVRKSKKNRKESRHEDTIGAGDATEPQYHHDQQQQQQQQQPPYSSGMYQQYPPPPYGYPPPGSGPMPLPHSTGGSCTCCRPHPFVPVHVPPQMPPYPMYYPYAQPPPPPPMMMMMPPPMLLQAPQPPQSQPGMQLVPFAQGQLAAYGGVPAGYGGLRPTLDRCEGCRGSGVGLVEKNGFCNHCNRLRLDFIVASARMRQRCSVCGGWGLGLVQVSTGKCDHCSRGAQQQRRGSVSRRQSSGETQQHQFPPGAVATPFASSEVLKRANSAKRVSVEDKKPDSIEWDLSSDDGSEWDD